MIFVRQAYKYYQCPFFQMEYDFQPRKKKSDKAKDKAGRYSSKHVRAYEAVCEKRFAACAGISKPVVKKP